jgi:hypothetical protein
MSFIDVDSLRAHLVEANRHVAERRELEVARVELAAAEQRNVDINDALQSCVASENALKATLKRRTALLRLWRKHYGGMGANQTLAFDTDDELADDTAEQPGKAEPPKCICAELIRQGFIGVQLDEMCPYLYHYHPAAQPGKAEHLEGFETLPGTPGVDVVPPFKGEKLPHPLPVPWEDVWVSSSDGTWTFDKVVERKELDEDHFQAATHGIMTRKSEGWLWDYFDVRTTKNDRVYQPAPAAPEATSDTCKPQPALTAATRSTLERIENFKSTVGALSGGTGHRDRCKCQDKPDTYPGTPHQHYRDAPYECARCGCRGYDPAEPGNATVAALETPAMCPKCSSTDLDERGNCYACLASASEPAPQPAEVTTENLDRLENILTISRWGRQPDDISSFAVTPTGCFVVRDAAILACGRDVNANVTRETEALRKTVEELERAALDFGATAAEFRLSDGTIKPKCPRPAYGDHFLGQLRNQCALCSQVAVLVETRIAPILAERDEARAQRDSLQAAATRLEAQRVDLERKLVRPWPS